MSRVIAIVEWPEPLADDIRVLALHERERGVGVPEVVESDVRQVGVLDESAPLSREHVRIPGPPVTAVDPKALFLPGGRHRGRHLHSPGPAHAPGCERATRLPGAKDLPCPPGRVHGSMRSYE